MAIAHKIIIAAYHMLSTGESYKELGDGYLDQRVKTRITNNLVRRLERMGYQVTLQAPPMPTAPSPTAKDSPTQEAA